MDNACPGVFVSELEQVLSFQKSFITPRETSNASSESDLFGCSLGTLKLTLDLDHW